MSHDYTKRLPLPQCGSGIIKFRTELTVKATKKGAEGSAASEQPLTDQTQYYGVQQGMSFDWEKCEKVVGA